MPRRLQHIENIRDRGSAIGAIIRAIQGVERTIADSAGHLRAQGLEWREPPTHRSAIGQHICGQGRLGNVLAVEERPATVVRRGKAARKQGADASRDCLGGKYRSRVECQHSRSFRSERPRIPTRLVAGISSFSALCRSHSRPPNFPLRQTSLFRSTKSVCRGWCRDTGGQQTDWWPAVGRWCRCGRPSRSTRPCRWSERPS